MMHLDACPCKMRPALWSFSLTGHGRSSQIPAGAGIVVVDPVSGVRISHEVHVPQCLVNHWRGLGKSQLIAELELLPVIIFFEHY